MEPSYTLTHSELIKVFEKWDTDHLNEYPTAKITNAVTDSVGQAREFARILNELRYDQTKDRKEAI